MHNDLRYPRSDTRSSVLIWDGHPPRYNDTFTRACNVHGRIHRHQVHTCTHIHISTCGRVREVSGRVFARLEVRSIRWRFSHLLAKWSVYPSASFCSYTNLNYVERARGAGEREACAEHEEAWRKKKRWERTEAARLLFFSASYPASSLHARRSEGCARSEAVREGARAGGESELRSIRGWRPHASSGIDHDHARHRYVSSPSRSLSKRSISPAESHSREEQGERLTLRNP